MQKHAYIEMAQANLRDLLLHAFECDAQSKVVLVYDDAYELTRLLTTAYRAVLPDAVALNFNATPSDVVLKTVDALSPGDLVVLIQSENFRLDEFRFRLHLFSLKLKVIEHLHLSRLPEPQWTTYIASLAYDPSYYRRLGHALKTRVDRAHEVRLAYGDDALVYRGPFESAKLNVGDYRGMANVGGQFPIGEVFTELRDLTRLDGRAWLFAFADLDFSVAAPKAPFPVDIAQGKITCAKHAPPAFHAVLDDIRMHDGEVWVRELGFGLNPALTRDTRLQDVGMYERMCGIHLSLGSKHAVYAKEGFSRKKAKCHVDVFAATDYVSIDEERVFEAGGYIL